MSDIRGFKISSGDVGEDSLIGGRRCVMVVRS